MLGLTRLGSVWCGVTRGVVAGVDEIAGSPATGTSGRLKIWARPSPVAEDSQP